MKYNYILSLLFICLLISTKLSFAQNTPQQVFQIDSTISATPKLNLNGQFCKIEITKSNDNLIHIWGELFSDKNDSEYKISLISTSDQTEIRVTYPSQGWSSHSGTIQLKIPQNIEMDIETSSGQIHSNQVNISNAKIISRSGNIELNDCKGAFSLETVTAKLNVTNLTGNMKCKSKTGDTYLSKINGNVTSNTSDGNITIADINGSVNSDATTGNTDIDRVVGDIKSKASSGFIKIADSKGNINVTTFSGAIKLFNTEGIVNLKSTTGEQVGTRIKLTASSSFYTTEGKIKMDLDNPIEELSFVLESSSSYLQAARESKKKKLKVGKGPIVVTGTSTTGAQLYN